METITLTIDGREVTTTKGKSILEAALDADIYIPNLCYHPDLTPWGACRLCVVEIEKIRGAPTSCTLQAENGMVVKTRTPLVDNIRRVAMELILANHPQDCLTCEQNLNCELQAVAQYLNIKHQPLRISPREIPVNTSNPLFDHDLSKCILCGRCVRACYELRGAGVLSFMQRGKDTYIGTAFDRSLIEANCRFCGACVEVCPTGALRDKRELKPGEPRAAALVPCQNACPAGIDIPRYIRFITQGKYPEAAAVIREKVPFPNVLGHVCSHPCELVCRRGEINEAISIRMLKRSAAEKEGKKTLSRKTRKNPATGKKVAVVGAGPAGLTAAYYLSKQGHEVTIFEALPLPGGMLRVGIPEYRLPRKVLDNEIKEMQKTGFTIKTNSRVNSLDNLFNQEYQAIFLAIGAHQGNKIGVTGDNLSGVIDAITFLREVGLGQKVEPGNNVAVIGGGNVAIDAARTALRLGSKNVTIIYRRTRAEMPAAEEEINGALEEGIHLEYLAAPGKIWSENNKLKLECIRMELGEADASGRRRPVPVKNSEFTATYDNIISAIGQALHVPENFNITTGKGNIIQTDNNSLTNRSGVFAGGDAVTTPASVISAITSGRQGAIAIDKYLGGNGVIDEQLAPVEEVIPWLGCAEGFARLKRQEITSLPASERCISFAEVEKGYDRKTSALESNRCLQCDLRMKITPVKLPPKRGTTKGSGQK